MSEQLETPPTPDSALEQLYADPEDIARAQRFGESVAAHLAEQGGTEVITTHGITGKGDYVVAGLTSPDSKDIFAYVYDAEGADQVSDGSIVPQPRPIVALGTTTGVHAALVGEHGTTPPLSIDEINQKVAAENLSREEAMDLWNQGDAWRQDAKEIAIKRESDYAVPNVYDGAVIADPSGVETAPEISPAFKGAIAAQIEPLVAVADAYRSETGLVRNLEIDKTSEVTAELYARKFDERARRIVRAMLHTGEDAVFEHPELVHDADVAHEVAYSPGMQDKIDKAAAARFGKAKKMAAANEAIDRELKNRDNQLRTTLEELTKE